MNNMYFKILLLWTLCCNARMKGLDERQLGFIKGSVNKSLLLRYMHGLCAGLATKSAVSLLAHARPTMKHLPNSLQGLVSADLQMSVCPICSVTGRSLQGLVSSDLQMSVCPICSVTGRSLQGLVSADLQMSVSSYLLSHRP